MSTIRRVLSTALGLTLACLLVPTAAWALTAERTYLPPFEAAEAILSGCDAPWCEGDSSADLSGSVAAEVHTVGAGVGRTDAAQAFVTLTHVVEEPATEIAIDVRVSIDGAYASALGAPFAKGTATVALEAWPSSASWAYTYGQDEVATAESPVGEVEVGARDLDMSITLGDGKRLIPAGPIAITVTLSSETTTMPPHALSLADACAASCVGAGKVDAGISGVVQSVTVRESR